MLKGKKMVKHLDLQHAYKSSFSIDVKIQKFEMNFCSNFRRVFSSFGCASLLKSGICCANRVFPK